MDIKAFLRSNAGEWFTQRSNYHLDGSKTENSKANITVEFIQPDHPQIVSLCQQNKLESNLSVGGLRYSWDNSNNNWVSRRIGTCHYSEHNVTSVSEAENEILKIYPKYKKVTDGIIISKKIGIEKMRQKCNHFNNWIISMEKI